MMHINPIKLITLLILTFLLCSYSSTSAQVRELGIRASGLENFGFIYKKEQKPNSYQRFRIGRINLAWRDLGEESSLATALGFAIGFEKRKAINDELYLIHGFEPSMILALSTNSRNLIYDIQPGLGYVLGFQYSFSEKFYINIESIPSINLIIRGTKGSSPVYTGNLGFNSNAVSITAAYRIVSNS